MTIKEIAKLASVSIGTVDRVINRRGHVSEEKRIIVEKILRETNFRPNMYARNLKLQQVTRIAFITPNLDTENGYWNLVYQGVRRAEKDLSDNSFIVDKYEYDRKNPASFQAVADKIVTTKPTGCLIIPKCMDVIRTFLEEHPSLPFVLLDSALPGLHPLCTISQNFFQGGFLAGRLVSLMQPNAQRIMTFSFLDSVASKERIRGFKHFFDSKNIDFLNVSSKEELLAICRKYFSEKSSADAIFSPCSMGYVIGNEIVKMGLKEKTKIITYDLIPENRQALLHGAIDCVISQRPVYQGYAGIYQLYRVLVQRQFIESELDIQIDIVLRENLPQDYNKEEFGKLNSYCIPSTLY